MRNRTAFDCRFRVKSYLCVILAQDTGPPQYFPLGFNALIRLKSDRSNLLSVTWIAVEEQSQPIQFLPSLCATTKWFLSRRKSLQQDLLPSKIVLLSFLIIVHVFRCHTLLNSCTLLCRSRYCRELHGSSGGSSILDT